MEGIYVRPDHRGGGGGKMLLDAAEDWARAKGCTEFACDSLLENVAAQKFHRHMGFEETGRVVQFAKKL